MTSKFPYWLIQEVNNKYADFATGLGHTLPNLIGKRDAVCSQLRRMMFNWLEENIEQTRDAPLEFRQKQVFDLAWRPISPGNISKLMNVDRTNIYHYRGYEEDGTVQDRIKKAHEKKLDA